MSRVRSSLITALFVIVAATGSLPAAAVVVTGGFSGQIFSGFDFTDYFGAGSDLDGQPITGTFRYDTAQVPPPSSTGPNSAVYSDPTFSTAFLDLSVTINGRTYTFGAFPAAPGIQSIEVIDNTDQLSFDYQRFGLSDSESLALRFISDIDFLTGTGLPTGSISLRAASASRRAGRSPSIWPTAIPFPRVSRSRADLPVP